MENKDHRNASLLGGKFHSKLAVVSKFFQKVSEIKIGHHFLQKKPATTPKYFLQPKFSQMYLL